MKKVLVVAGKMNVGGIQSMVMNFFRNLDRDKVMFDFMLNYEEPGCFDEEIRSYGSKIYIMPRLKPQNIFRYIKAVKSFFKEHQGEYDIIHGHLTSVGIIYLHYAKKYGIKTRIIHAHYTDTRGNHYAFLEKLMLKPLKLVANYFFACSDEAGKFCYGKDILNKPNYKMLANGVDVKRFSFSEEIRKQTRDELGISDNTYVLLNLGRFEKQKNHKKLLEIFADFNKKHNNSILIMLGDGSLFEEMKEYAKSLKIYDYCKFMGIRNDAEKIMAASDLFLLPSLFEGAPVACVEAQASGLPCVVSDTVTTEIDIINKAEFVGLNDKDEIWTAVIEKYINIKRENTDDILISKGFDVYKSSKWLEKFYLTH